MFDPRVRYVTIALSPALIVLNTSAEELFAVPGVRADDMVLAVQKPTAQAGLGIVGYRVSSEGNIGITFQNSTGSSITPTAAETYSIALLTKQP